MPAQRPVLAVALVVRASQLVRDPRAAISNVGVDGLLPTAIAQDLEALPTLLGHLDPVDEAPAVELHVVHLEVVPSAGDPVLPSREVVGLLLRGDVQDPTPDDLPLAEFLLLLAIGSSEPLAGWPDVADAGDKHPAARVIFLRRQRVAVLQRDVRQHPPAATDEPHEPVGVGAGLGEPQAQHETDEAQGGILGGAHAEDLGPIVVLGAEYHQVQRDGLPVLRGRGVVQVGQRAQHRVVANSLVHGIETLTSAHKVLLHLNGPLHAVRVAEALENRLLDLHEERMHALALADVLLVQHGAAGGHLLALLGARAALAEEVLACEGADECALKLDELLQLHVAVRLGRLDVQQLGLPVTREVLVKVRVTVADEDLLALVHVRGGVELQDPPFDVQRALRGRPLGVVVQRP
mmetsp:Transcript_99806/g.310898  ORF Transcript_99806/g.310898 Transcript_99806/m.310898 type:complete len:407 (-) Transcript_99806:263-1483(-)